MTSKTAQAIADALKKNGSTLTQREMQERISDVLKPFVGTPATPDAIEHMGVVAADYIKEMLKTPSPLRNLFRPILEPPFRQWRDLGIGALTHSVGTHAITGVRCWMRFCDYAEVSDQFNLSHYVQVDCLGCLAREDSIMADSRASR